MVQLETSPGSPGYSPPWKPSLLPRFIDDPFALMIHNLTIEMCFFKKKIVKFHL